MSKVLSKAGIVLLTGAVLSVLSFFIVTNGSQSVGCFTAPPNPGPLDELRNTIIYQPERGFPFGYYAENLSALKNGCAGSNAEGIQDTWNASAFIGDVLIWSAVSSAGFFAYTRLRRHK
jgi:hypothetical protein